MMTSAAGSLVIVRMPSRLRLILPNSRDRIAIIFLLYSSAVPSASAASNSSRRCKRERIVRKLLSVPPSQRSMTYGMPTRIACC